MGQVKDGREMYCSLQLSLLAPAQVVQLLGQVAPKNKIPAWQLSLSTELQPNRCAEANSASSAGQVHEGLAVNCCATRAS